MWILIISLVALGVVAAVAGIIRDRRLQRKVDNGELDAKTATQEQILYLAAGYNKLEGKPAPTLSHEA